MKQSKLQVFTDLRLLKILVVCSSLFFSLHLSATDYTSINSAVVRSNWTSAGSWSATVPPYSSMGSNDKIYITGAANQSIMLSNDMVLDNNSSLSIASTDTLIVRNLTINSGSNVYVAGVLIVIGTLTNAQQIADYSSTAGTIVVYGNVSNTGNINGGVVMYYFGTWTGDAYGSAKTQAQFNADYASSTTMYKSVAAANESLPIELTSFKAKLTRENILLTWTTATETNNDYFLLERSNDGKNWEAIYSCKGAGTTSIAHSYSFVDYELQSQVCYYRLKQTDFDGNFSYSKVITVNNQLQSIVKVFPSVFDGEHLSVSGLTNGDNKIMILSAFGQVQYVADLKIDGSMTVDLDLEKKLPVGYYFVQTVSADSQINTYKVIAY
jgi:hypothetical protein